MSDERVFGPEPGTFLSSLRGLRDAVEARDRHPNGMVTRDATGRCSSCGRRAACACEALVKARYDAATAPRRLRLDRVRHALELVTNEDRDRILDGRLGEDPRAREAWSKVSAWLGTTSAFLVLQGEKGSGKTCAALGAVADRGGRVMPVLDVVRAWRNEHAEAQALRDTILAVPFLVLEDLGTEPDDMHAVAAFHALVDRRQSRRRTAITTNLDRRSLAQRYDERTLERIDHQGVWCQLRTKNLRRGRPS